MLNKNTFSATKKQDKKKHQILFGNILTNQILFGAKPNLQNKCLNMQ